LLFSIKKIIAVRDKKSKGSLQKAELEKKVIRKEAKNGN